MIKLSDRQARVIRSYELQPLASTPEVAKVLKLKTHTVRRELNFLKEAGVLRPVVVINPAAFGYHTFDLVFSTSAETGLARKEFIKDLLNSGIVSVVREIGGEYEFDIAVLAKNASEVFRLLSNLEQKHGLFLTERRVAHSLMFYGFGRKYLSPKIACQHYEEPRVSDKQVQLDELDHRILATMTQNSFSSYAELARAIEVKPSTFEYRLERLKKQGVVCAVVYAVNGRMFGNQLFYLAVTAHTLREKFKKEFFNFCKQHPHIVNLIELFGSWDFNVSIEVETEVKVPEIVFEMKKKFGDKIQKIRVIPILYFHKLKTYPFTNLPN